MSGLQLPESKASYMTKTNDSILISSPIEVTKQQKGQIGIYLKGLRKPNDRLNVQFIPVPNLQAIRLEWTMVGAILYLEVTKGKIINVGQHIGTLRWQPFELQGKMMDATRTIRF